MAWQFDVNSSNNSTQLAVMLRWKALATANGWVVQSSGTGASGTGSGVFSATTDLITTLALFTNPKAWFRIKCPNGREFCIQNVAGTMRVKYSVLPGFVGGTPSASLVPSATDEVVLPNAGGGTDAAPTGGVQSVDGTYKAHIILGQAAEGYSFAIVGIINGGTNNTGFTWIFDAMVVGLTPAADADPYVHCWAGQLSGSSFTIYSWWKRYGLSGAAFNATGSASMLSNNLATQNPYTAGDDLFPLFFKGGDGFKGVSTLFRLPSVVSRGLADTWTMVSAMDHINISASGLALPWAGVVPVL